MIVCETERLTLRHITADDAAFILELLNEPDFIRNIGDREVRTLDDARRYIQHGPVASYQQHGFGLLLVALKDTGAPVGICGLLERDYLDDVDIGFALAESFRGRGYAFEAASAVMNHGKQVLGLGRIVAITAPDNYASISLLRRLGLEFERTIAIPGQTRDTRLFTPAAPEQSLLSSTGQPARGATDEEAEAGRSRDAETGGADR